MAVHVEWQAIKVYLFSHAYHVKLGDKLFSFSFSKVDFTRIKKVTRYLNSEALTFAIIFEPYNVM